MLKCTSTELLLQPVVAVIEQVTFQLCNEFSKHKAIQ